MAGMSIADEPALAAGPPPVRYHALDAARGILMMLGIVLHTSMIFALHTPWKIADARANAFFDTLAHAIYTFRMPAFFWISGFFCALTFEKLGAAGLLGRRVPRLAVPLVSAWLFLNVPQELLLAMHESIDPRSVFRHQLHLSHLWFLLDLLVYMGLAAIALPFLPRELPRPPRWLEGSVVLQVVILAAVTQLVVDAARATPIAYVQPMGATSLFRLATYLPFFAAGIAMYGMPAVRETFSTLNPWWLVPALAAALVARQIGPASGRLVHEAALFVGTVAAWTCVAAVLSLFRRVFRDDSPFVRAISEASYTVYLFHHFIVILLGLALLPVALPAGAKFTIISITTLALTYVIHVALVRRVRVLRFLFNGK
jgi:glucan biosynthesis protein C